MSAWQQCLCCQADVVHSPADDDFVICRNAHYWQCLRFQANVVRPAVDDDFIICRNAHYWQCLCCQGDVVRPAADDEFVTWATTLWTLGVRGVKLKIFESG